MDGSGERQKAGLSTTQQSVRLSVASVEVMSPWVGGKVLRGCPGDGRAEGREAAGVDCAVAAGEALDGEGQKLFRADYCEGLAPGADVRKEPGWIAADGEAADGAEGVAGVEGAVAFVEEGEVAGDVAGGFDAEE